MIYETITIFGLYGLVVSVQVYCSAGFRSDSDCC